MRGSKEWRLKTHRFIAGISKNIVPTYVVKKQIDSAKFVPRNNLLEYRPVRENNRTQLVVNYNFQLRPQKCIINSLQPIPYSL